MTTPIQHNLGANVRTSRGGGRPNNENYGKSSHQDGPHREQRVQRESEAATWAPVPPSHRANPARVYGPQGKWMP